MSNTIKDMFSSEEARKKYIAWKMNVSVDRLRLVDFDIQEEEEDDGSVSINAFVVFNEPMEKIEVRISHKAASKEE